MSTYIDSYMTPADAQRLRADTDHLSSISSGARATPFQFMANFDGTNNDKDNLAIAGDPYQTNVANIYDQAKVRESDYLKSGYYSGVGTGGINGNMLNAGILPTESLRNAAERAYREFTEQARDYLNKHPGATYNDISVSIMGFSRGAISGVFFAQMVNDRGLRLPDGTQIAPPGSIPVNAMALLDPVDRYTQGNDTLPDNVRGKVLVLAAHDEHRSDFRLTDYSSDPRVNVITLPGNHCGVGGGYDQQGTAAAAREIATAYLRNSGVDIEPVPMDKRFDPTQPVPIYTENYNHYIERHAHNGDWIGRADAPVMQGNLPMQVNYKWRVDGGDRQTVQPGTENDNIPHARNGDLLSTPEAPVMRGNQPYMYPRNVDHGVHESAPVPGQQQPGAGMSEAEAEQLINRMYRAATSTDRAFADREYAAMARDFKASPDGQAFEREVDQYRQQIALEREQQAQLELQQRQAQEQQQAQEREPMAHRMGMSR